mmetsp:Transcript_48887/g.156327  ORF Transcript_48887/g.156327 Transcript_48887/m.156327 type:complete len:408 (+) Transcript_48887:91-1314(+)
MASLIWLGALLGVFASMTGTVGKQLLRFSELQRLKGTKPALCLARACLVGGLVLNTIVGPIVDMASYAFAPQSVIAPLGGLDVVWNTLSAPCTLGETLTVQLLLGCGLIAGGATATSCFGSKEDQKFTPEVLKETLFRWTVLAYCVVLLAWLLFNILVLIPRSAAPKGQPFATGDKLRGLSLGMTAGSIAGNMFCVKAFVEVVQASIEDGKSEYWLDWLPYVLFAGALFFALTNLYFLTKAMREYEALFMGAVFEGSLVVSACVSGTIVFAEMESLEAWQICIYWLAILAIVVGIFTVARGSAPEESKEEESAEKSDAKGSEQGCRKPAPSQLPPGAAAARASAVQDRAWNSAEAGACRGWEPASPGQARSCCSPGAACICNVQLQTAGVHKTPPPLDAQGVPVEKE